MNKILIALVLAVMMSGNVYSEESNNKQTEDEFRECLKAVEKGKQIFGFEMADPLNWYIFESRVFGLRLVSGKENIQCIELPDNKDFNE
jgi:hypothetical protein